MLSGFSRSRPGDVGQGTSKGRALVSALAQALVQACELLQPVAHAPACSSASRESSSQKTWEPGRCTSQACTHLAFLGVALGPLAKNGAPVLSLCVSLPA
jgi:hypothetical protein